jgi:hypothetical protein
MSLEGFGAKSFGELSILSRRKAVYFARITLGQF